MLSMREIWQNSHGRARATFVGGAGIGAVLIAFAPVWDGTAAAAPSATFAPTEGAPGTPMTFQVSGCVDLPNSPLDVIIEVNTDTGQPGNLDQSARPFAANGTYQTVAPFEWDLELGDPTAGPTYDVHVACYESLDEGATLSVAKVGTFTYPRTSTTSTSSTTTSTTAPASTTSTTPASTTTTAPASTTSTTPASTTTTAPASTTSTAPASTTTTAPVATTTSSTTSSTTTTTAPIGATTTAPTSTTSPSTTSTTAPSTTCTVSDATPSPGQTITGTCAGFAPATGVTVDLLSDPVRLRTLTANAQGVASGSITIPITTTGGAHTVRFTGTAPDGTQLVRNVAVTVERELPRTGTDSTWTMFRVAALLLGVGLLAVGRSQLLATRDGT